MSGCCNERGCRRKQPMKLMRGGLTGQWYVVTRWRETAPGQFYALEKHALTSEQCADLDTLFDRPGDAT